MAIRKMTDGVSAWTNKTPFPKDRYQVSCIEESFNLSKSSDNPMITRVWEIVSPEVVAAGDRQLSVAGLKITQYCTIKVKNKDANGRPGEGWDVEASDKAFGRFRDELLIVGFDVDTEVDDENPPLFMKGKTVDAVIYSKKDVSRKSPTPEQLRKGIKQGDPIKDGNNQDVVNYTLAIEAVLGLAQTQANVAF